MKKLTKWEIIKDKAGVEAGYVNHSDDLGKGTNHGITQETALEWKHLWPKYNWDGDMRTLPIELAYEIYDLGWWKKLFLDDVILLSDALAERLFDFGINAGRSNAVMSLQRVLNVMNKKGSLWQDISADGGMGKNTLSALKKCLSISADNASNVEFAMFGMQTYHYLSISEKREANESFTNGWFNRVRRDCKNYWDRAFNN